MRTKSDEKAAKDYLESKIYGDGVDGYNETYVHTFPAEDYSIQQDYSPHFLEHSQADGSQKRMIIPSDLAQFDSEGNPVLYTFKDGDEIKFQHEWDISDYLYVCCYYSNHKMDIQNYIRT